LAVVMLCANCYLPTANCLLTPQALFGSHAPTLKLRRKRKLILSEGFSPGWQ